MDNAHRDSPTQRDLELRKLELEQFKARLDYRKFVLGSVFVALAIAAIPPCFSSRRQCLSMSRPKLS
jgi:hypothetical protein